MISQFSLKPAGDFAAVHQRILKHVDEDRGILRKRQKAGVDILVFGVSAENLPRLRMRYEQKGTVDDRYGVIHVRPTQGELSVNAICDDDSLAQLQEFVRWVLDTFGPCQIRDDERRRDITRQVEANRDYLFV